MIGVVLGLQYGDEGKGRYLDYLLKDYDVSVRFNGGSNAGHQCSINGKTYAVHLVPTGVFRGKESLVGNQCVLDPISFCQQLDYLTENGFNCDCIKIGSRVSLICPCHKLVDKFYQTTNKTKLGTTKQGIGPAYADKMNRIALRMQDCLLSKDKIFEKYTIVSINNNSHIMPQDMMLSQKLFDKFYQSLMRLKKYMCDVTDFFEKCITSGKNILFQGAQSTQLDLTWGEYPFVTSSSCLAQNAMLSVGYRFNFDKVYGVFKAYTTRVGTGPFITKMQQQLQNKTRQVGHQYGVTTGRPRICGWLDLVSLKRSCVLNGVTDLCMVKQDVLNNYDTVNACYAYKDNTNGDIMNRYPYTSQFQHISPVYELFEGWKDYKDKKLNNFLQFIENKTNVKIKYLSYSPKREDVIEL